MKEELRHKLVKSEREISNVKDDLEKTLSELYRLEGKRKELLLKVRELRAESLTCRDRLNVLREEIKGLNETLTNLRRERNEKITHLREIRERIKEYLKAKPKIREEDLEKEISNLDWRIQTFPLPLDEEKRVIARIKSLEEQLHFYRKLKDMRDEARAAESDLEEIKKKINACVNALVDRVLERKRVRERLTEIFREINEVKAEIERINGECKRFRERVSELRSKYRDLLGQVRAVREAIRYEEESERSERISMLKEKIKERVSEKIKRGEKVSFEELKVFFEDEEAEDI
ncbi:MAG: hypothetical protein QXR84_00480 [Candidatus Bathyarchaeia archaeon]|nr:hypothetical protein [Candidatus Bathyarchaeota archaeon]